MECKKNEFACFRQAKAEVLVSSAQAILVRAEAAAESRAMEAAMEGKKQGL